MYVPRPRAAAQRSMLLELLSNSLDLLLAGTATKIRIDEQPDGSFVVEDDGPGIPSEVLLASLSAMHDSPTQDGHRPHVHLAAHVGIGIAAVCALSELFEVDTSDGDRRARYTYSRGEPIGEPRVSPANGRRGTSIRVVPDSTIYPDEPEAEHDRRWREVRGPLDMVAERLADLAPGLTLECSGRAHHSSGLVERARRLGASERRPLLERTASHAGSRYRVVLGWRDDGGSAAEELVGNYRLASWNDRGWIGTALLSYAQRRELGPAWKVADGRIALCAIEDVSMKWGSPTRTMIVDPAHRRHVRELLYEALDALCGTAPADALAFTRRVPP